MGSGFPPNPPVGNTLAPDKNISNNDDQEAIINVIQQETGTQKNTIWEHTHKTHPIGKHKQGKQQCRPSSLCQWMANFTATPDKSRGKFAGAYNPPTLRNIICNLSS